MRGYEKDGQVILGRNGKIRHPETGQMVNIPKGDCPRPFFGVTLLDVVPEPVSGQSNPYKHWTASAYRLQDDVILETRHWTDLPKPDPDVIRLEAQNRILAFCPEWRQRNLTARAAELALKQSSGSVLSDDEQTEYQDGQKVWDHIKAIRASSDVLEESCPIDYQDDKYWPEVSE